MNMKKVIFRSLAIGGGLILTRKLFAATSSAQTVDDPATFDAIDAYIEGQMRRLKIPGLSLAIVEGDQIVHLRGFGRTRPGGETPTPQTPFLIGSVTKSVTALAVMQLVEGGKVNLDAPVQHYLPWFQVADPEASARITVRHLLNQTSGMSTLAGMICVDDSDDSPDATEHQARAFSTLKLNRPVGASFQYCNLNYNLLGLVIEAASGQSYAEYVQEHIFTPLDMRHTYTSQVRAKQNGLAMGHRYWFGIPIAAHNIPIPPSSLPAGGLISTSEDIAHYLIAHLNSGRYGEAQIISSAGIDELHRDVAEQRVLGTSVTAYGMGWFVDKLDGTKLVSHGGNVPDFSAFVGLLPEQKKGVVLLVNADHGFPFILMEVGEGVAALLAGQQAPPIRLGFLPWMMRASALIPLLQIVGVVTTLRRLRCWRRDPALRPGCGRVWGEHILLPLIPNFSLAAILAYLRSSGLIRFMHLYMPDLSWIARISGGFAGIWAFLRTRLILQNLNCTSTPSTHLEDTNL
jgi:CubicO group peptidase (beta-lactamase class C family)